MTAKNTKVEIQKLIANRYAETHVGFHAEYRYFGDGEFRRGAYAQIAGPWGDTHRIYAHSYAALLEKLLRWLTE